MVAMKDLVLSQPTRPLGLWYVTWGMTRKHGEECTCGFAMLFGIFFKETLIDGRPEDGGMESSLDLKDV